MWADAEVPGLFEGHFRDEHVPQETELGVSLLELVVEISGGDAENHAKCMKDLACERETFLQSLLESESYTNTDQEVRVATLEEAGQEESVSKPSEAVLSTS